MASAPTVRTHELEVPRILYLHSWSSTQDEGWVRAALETYGVPFTYMGDKELAHMSNLRAQYDVVLKRSSLEEMWTPQIRATSLLLKPREPGVDSGRAFLDLSILENSVSELEIGPPTWIVHGWRAVSIGQFFSHPPSGCEYTSSA